MSWPANRAPGLWVIWARVLMVAAVAAPACAGDGPEPAAQLGSHIVPSGTLDFKSAEWSRVAEGAAVVATVNGASITLDQLREQQRHLPHLTVAQLLDRLVEMELMAQQAQVDGLARHPAVVDHYRKALVQRYVLDVFRPSHTSDKITMEEVQRIYAMPRVRKMYDHAAGWRIAHLMFTCCDPKVEDCGQAAVVECFALAGDAIHRLYEELKPRIASVDGDPDAVDQLLQDFRRDMEAQYRELAYRQMSFYYNPDVPHAQQKGYNVIDEALAQSVIRADKGVVQAPIQSSFGWHIPVLLDSMPEERKGADDPQVIRDIRVKAMPMRLKAWFTETANSLRGRHGVTVAEDVLARLER